MWITALGKRVLRGAEWELLRAGLPTLWDDIESQQDDEESGTTEVKAFDRLTGPERLALLAQLAMGIHESGEPCPDLTALNEAAIAAVFAQVRYLVAVEIDAQRSGFGPFSRDRAGRPREPVLAAAREVAPEQRATLPETRSTDASEWYPLIQTMLVGEDGGRQVGQERAGGQAVDRDPLAADLDGAGAGQTRTKAYRSPY